MSERSFGPVVVRRRLGAELRRLREAAGMSLDQAARTLEISASKLSRVETGHSPPKLWDVRNLLTVYGVTDEAYRRRAERWVSEGRAQGWWAPYSDAVPTDLDYYISLEAEAASIQHYSAPYLYGLLQTEEYAQNFLVSVLPGLPQNELDRLVEVRVGRQHILHGSDAPALEVVIDEAALERPVGDLGVMRRQYLHLLEVSDAINIRVRPLSAAPHIAALTPFTIFAPREDDTDWVVVNVETGYHDLYWEGVEGIRRFLRSFTDLQDSSLSSRGSRNLIDGLARRAG